jgi:hypothetical protein
LGGNLFIPGLCQKAQAHPLPIIDTQIHNYQPLPLKSINNTMNLGISPENFTVQLTVDSVLKVEWADEIRMRHTKERFEEMKAQLKEVKQNEEQDWSVKLVLGELKQIKSKVEAMQVDTEETKLSLINIEDNVEKIRQKMVITDARRRWWLR